MRRSNLDRGTGDKMADVIVVDDEEAMCRVVTATLEMDGLTAVAVSDARAALALLRESPPRLVLTDVFLPEMDGIELLAAIRREAPYMPVVLMSGGGQYRNAAPLVAAGHLGATATLAKPFTPKQLLEVVRKALGES
jgi:DNA-binding NtrC family response regulator